MLLTGIRLALLGSSEREKRTRGSVFVGVQREGTWFLLSQVQLETT